MCTLLLKLLTPLNFQTALSHDGNFLPKMEDIFFDQLIKSYRLLSKKNLPVLVQKLTFFAVGQVSNVII